MVTTKHLQAIRDADPSKVPFDKALFVEMQKYIKERTNNFSDVSGLSKDPVDMTSDIKNAGKSVQDFKQKYGSTSYSEQDIAEYIGNLVSGNAKATKTDKNEAPSAPATLPRQDSDEEERLRIKAKAARAKKKMRERRAKEYEYEQSLKK